MLKSPEPVRMCLHAGADTCTCMRVREYAERWGDRAGCIGVAGTISCYAQGCCLNRAGCVQHNRGTYRASACSACAPVYKMVGTPFLSTTEDPVKQPSASSCPLLGSNALGMCCQCTRLSDTTWPQHSPNTQSALLGMDWKNEWYLQRLLHASEHFLCAGHQDKGHVM